MDPKAATVFEGTSCCGLSKILPSRRLIATEILAGLVSTGNFDGSNQHQVTTAAKIAVAYADALISELSK